MNLAVAIALLWIGCALLWVARTGIGVNTPWDAYKKLLGALDSGGGAEEAGDDADTAAAGGTP